MKVLSAIASRGLTVLLDLFLIPDQMPHPWISTRAYRFVLKCLFHPLCVVQIESIQNRNRERKSGLETSIRSSYLYGRD